MALIQLKSACFRYDPRTGSVVYIRRVDEKGTVWYSFVAGVVNSMTKEEFDERYPVISSGSGDAAGK